MMNNYKSTTGSLQSAAKLISLFAMTVMVSMAGAQEKTSIPVQTDSREDAIAYAAQRLPKAIEAPVIQLSETIKQAGFIVKVVDGEKRVKLLELVSTKKWMEAIDFAAGYKVTDREQVNRAIDGMRFNDFRTTIAVLSPKVSTSTQYYNEVKMWSLGLVVLPAKPSDLLTSRSGHLRFQSPTVESGSLGMREMELHPTGKGYLLMLSSGPQTCILFTDGSDTKNTGELKELIDAAEAPIQELSGRRALNEITEAQLNASAEKLVGDLIAAIAAKALKM